MTALAQGIEWATTGIVLVVFLLVLAICAEIGRAHIRGSRRLRRSAEERHMRETHQEPEALEPVPQARMMTMPEEVPPFEEAAKPKKPWPTTQTIEIGHWGAGYGWQAATVGELVEILNDFDPRALVYDGAGNAIQSLQIRTTSAPPSHLERPVE